MTVSTARSLARISLWSTDFVRDQADGIAVLRTVDIDLIETFKIVNRKYDINPELFFSAR